MIQKILIANRGEIACRILRTCRQMGIGGVAVYSEADADAAHVEMADEAVNIGPAPAAESYLNFDAVIQAAVQTGADAVHPGYGFLAENGAFARACGEAGLTFIGPTPEAIEIMGDKGEAKRLVEAAGVPVIPGYHGRDQNDDALQAAAARLGYPLLVKAAAGGGGRGMRMAASNEELPDALAGARREALGAFGSDRLMLEKPIKRARHIEFQVFGDQQGQIIHLGERECSVQRRYQKVIEESPSPALSPSLRQQMGQAAVAAAAAVDYTGAGTVEFLLDEDGRFYFLEMNTRLQVEHPVTELVTGLDLVEWQIRVAAGENLPLAAEDLKFTGHAIEARLYAEQPDRGFLPATGKILMWRPPSAEGIRVDSGVANGSSVSMHYDPLLAKVIAHGRDRAAALRRLTEALAGTALLGVASNHAFLLDVLRHPAFVSADLSTQFIDQHLPEWRPATGEMTLALTAAAAACYLRDSRIGGGYWRNNPNRPPLYRFVQQGAEEAVDVYLRPASGSVRNVQVSIEDETHEVVIQQVEPANLALIIDGRRQQLFLAEQDAAWWVRTPAGSCVLAEQTLLPQPIAQAGAGSSLRAPMPGSVLSVLVAVGQQVSKGQPLMKLEAMKMEHTIRTSADGVVEAIFFGPGDTVEADARLLQIGRFEGSTD